MKIQPFQFIKNNRSYFWSSIILLWLAVPAIANPYPYKVTRVIDGDTIEIEVDFLPPELGNKLKVRILGVDTAEKGGLAKCEKEKKTSTDAKHFVEEMISRSLDISVEIKKWDKYGGRVLGDIILDGKKLSVILLENNFAVSYDGRKKIKDWCK